MKWPLFVLLCSTWLGEARVDTGAKKLNESTIGRTDDPTNLFVVPAFGG